MLIASVLVMLSARASGASVGVSVVDFGAVPNGLDSRAAIQAALDAGAGHEVYFPPGSYLVGAAPAKSWCLWVWPGTTLVGGGVGSTILAQGAVPASTVLLWIQDAPGVSIRSMSLVGQRAIQGPPLASGPQRHGVFVKNSPRLLISSAYVGDFAGDGAYLYAGSDLSTIVDSDLDGNERNGVTLGGQTKYVSAVGSRFTRNADGWHAEGGGRNTDVSLIGCTFDQNSSFAIVMSGTGADPDRHNYRWTVAGNVVNGPVLASWVDDVIYAGNRGVNPTAQPSVWVYRSSAHIRVVDNILSSTGPAAQDTGGIVYVVGTNPGQSPDDVTIARNDLSSARPQYGVVAISASRVVVEENRISGAGGSGPEAGVFARVTRAEVPVSIDVRGNQISDFGSWGIRLGGSSGVISRARIMENAFSGAMRAAMNLDDGLGEAVDVEVSENQIDARIGTSMVNPPRGIEIPLQGTRWISATP